MTNWALQDARNKFSAVVEAALAGTPQQVTRNTRHFRSTGVELIDPFA